MTLRERIFVFVLCLLVISINDGSAASRYERDIKTKSGLTHLYNSRVVYAEEYARPVNNPRWSFWPPLHSGVVVTTVDGDKWLVHKGDEYGQSSQTVVTHSCHQSSKWWRVRGHAVRRSRVADYVRVGGSNPQETSYSATQRMMRLP